MSAIIDRLRKTLAGRPAAGSPVQAMWKGTVLARSDRTRVVEGNHYFPPDDVDTCYLEVTDRQTTCPWKGRASYYDVVVGADRNPAAAWYYPRPKPAAAEIAGHIAFWHGVTVEAVPQP